MFGNDDFLGIGAGLFELAFQPFQSLAGILRAIAQAIEQLGGEGGVLCVCAEIGQDRLPVGAVVGGQDLVCHIVGDLTHLTGSIDPDRQPAQIFDQHEAQQRRQRPEFADLQRLDRLKTLDDGLEHRRRNGTVRMCDIGPGQRQRARHAAAVRQFQGRQLAIEAARQVALDLENGLFDQVIVVEQPLCRRRDRLAPRLRRIGRPVDFQNLLGAVADTGLKIEGRQPEQICEVAFRQAFTEQPKALFGQVIGADRLFGDGREARACLLDLGRIRLNIH